MELNVSTVQVTPKTSAQKTAATPIRENAALKAAADSFTSNNSVSFGASELQLARSAAKKAKVKAFNSVREMINFDRIREIVKGVRAASSIDYLLEPKFLRDKSQLTTTMRIVSGLSMPKIQSEQQAARALKGAIEEKLASCNIQGAEEAAKELKKAGLISDVEALVSKMQEYIKALDVFKAARKGKI